MNNTRDVGRIGIFQYDWAMYSFIKEFIIKLAETGYAVDIFQKDPNIKIDFTDTNIFTYHNNIRYYNFKSSNTLAQRIVRKGKRMLEILSENYRQNKSSFLDGDIILRSKNIVKKSAYQCFIGVEKKGLIWAGCLAQGSGIPLIYYSLELYIEDHPDIKYYGYLRKEEKKYHRKARATIIQDKRRANMLLEYNGVANSNVIYFPISVKGAVVQKKSDYFQRKYKLKETTKVILYYGLIQDERYSGELVRMAANMNYDMMLVLHGFGEREYLTRLQSTADKERVRISLQFVPEEQIVDIISSATIALALYEDSSSNDRLVAFSSVKMAYYLQCGVPFISFESESFRELLNTHRCGEMINSIDEIPQKASMILRDYESYREQAFLAFKRHFDFDQNFKSFIKDYSTLINNKCKL